MNGGRYDFGILGIDVVNVSGVQRNSFASHNERGSVSGIGISSATASGSAENKSDAEEGEGSNSYSHDNESDLEVLPAHIGDFVLEKLKNHVNREITGKRGIDKVK